MKELFPIEADNLPIEVKQGTMPIPAEGKRLLSRYQEVSGRPCRSMRRLRCDGCFFWRSYPG